MINKIRCRDWIDTEKTIWIVSPEYHALLHIEKDTEVATTEEFFEEYPLYTPEWYYASGILSGDYIVCIPFASKNIAVYSLREKSMFYIPVVDCDQPCPEIYNPSFQFFGGYAYDGNVLVFGATYPALININPEEKKIDYIDDWVTDIERLTPQGDDRFYFGNGYVRLESELFIPMTCCGAFLAIELETLQCRVVIPPDKMDGIEGATGVEDGLCFIGRKENLYYLYLWHPKDEKLKKFQIPYQGKSVVWTSFLSPVFWKSRVYLIPQTADHFYVVDLESEEIGIEKRMETMISEFPAETQKIRVSAWKQNGNIVIFHTWWDYKWHKYNLDTWEYEELGWRFDDENYSRNYQRIVCDKLIDEKNIISEETIPVSVFLNRIKNMEQPHSEWEASFGIKEKKWKTFLKAGH